MTLFTHPPAKRRRRPPGTAPPGRWRTLAVSAACFWIAAPAIEAQEATVEPEKQAVFMLTVLEYDRALPARAGDEVVIGVLHQSVYRESVNMHDRVLRTLVAAAVPVAGTIPVSVVSLDARDGNVRDLLERHEVDVVFITPLRALRVEDVLDATRGLDVLSFTGVPEYVRRGAAVGVRALGGRPRLMVNDDGANEEGVEFSSELLKLAEIVGGLDL